MKNIFAKMLLALCISLSLMSVCDVAQAYQQCRWVHSFWRNGNYHPAHKVCWNNGYNHGARHCGWHNGVRTCWYN